MALETQVVLTEPVENIWYYLYESPKYNISKLQHLIAHRELLLEIPPTWCMGASVWEYRWCVKNKVSYLGQKLREGCMILSHRTQAAVSLGRSLSATAAVALALRCARGAGEGSARWTVAKVFEQIENRFFSGSTASTPPR